MSFLDLSPGERGRLRAESFGLRFAEAKTFVQLEELRIELTTEISAINAQLAERHVVERIDQEEYRRWRTWRASAINAKVALEKRLAMVKLKLKQVNTVFNNGTPDKLQVDSVERLLWDARTMLCKFTTNFEVTPEEQVEVDNIRQRIQDYLATHGSIDAIKEVKAP